MTNQAILDWCNGGWRNGSHVTTIGGKLGIDTDGYYGFQCKDLANAYAELWGHPFTAGNADTLWTTPQDPWWQKVPYSSGMTLHIGDVPVYKYNHVDICMTDGSGSYEGLDQNWYNSSATVGSSPDFVVHQIDSNLYGVLRPQKGGSVLDPADQNLKDIALALLATVAGPAIGHDPKQVKVVIEDYERAKQAGISAEPFKQKIVSSPAWQASGGDLGKINVSTGQESSINKDQVIQYIQNNLS